LVWVTSMDSLGRVVKLSGAETREGTPDLPDQQKEDDARERDASCQEQGGSNYEATGASKEMAPPPDEIGRVSKEPDPSELRVGEGVSADARSSGFSLLAKSCIPQASFAQAFAMSSIAYMPNVYISLFRGDARLIGLANITMVIVDISINPWIGRLSDTGFFNCCYFSDVHSWGRRAPLMLLSIPVCMLSCVLFWIGPESLQSPVAVAMWYTAARLLMTIGIAMFESAFQSGFTELFPSKAERVSLGLAKFFAALVGGGLGLVGIVPSAVGMKDPGSPNQRQLFALFGLLTGVSWTLAVPYARLQRRSIMKKIVPSSSWSSMADFWRSSPAFRCLAISTHFYGAGFMLLLTALPFVFEAALKYTPEQVETALRTVIFGAGSMVPLSLPLVAYISKRLDPSVISAVAGFLSAFTSACHLHATYGIPGQFWPQVVQMSIVCGAGVSVLAVSWTSAQSALFAWVVDEDQVRQAERDGGEEVPARRDGMINAFRSIFSISAGAWAGAFQFLLGTFGYDGDRFSKGEPQPEEVRVLLEILYALVIPVMFIIFAVPMLYFPLRGQRLATLLSDYQKLYDRLTSESGTPAPADPSLAKGQDGQSDDGLSFSV